MLSKDVVCGMQTALGNNRLVYLGVTYSFCSEQCRERFVANPHLYVGVPGHAAPRQQGASVIKRRTLRLADPLSPGQAKMLGEALQSMMGIHVVSAEGHGVTITYDLLVATEQQIEQRLAEIGVQLGDGLVERLHRAFVHYEEECEIGNLEVSDEKYGHWNDG